MAIGPIYRCFIEAVRERGVDVGRILRTLGLTEATLSDPSTRLSPELGRAFGGAMFRAVGVPSIGLDAALRFRVGDFDLFGYLMKYAPDLWGVLMAGTQYKRLLGDTASFDVERLHDRVVVSVGRSGGRQLLHEASDFAAGALMLAIRELVAPEVIPLEVQLPRDRPADERVYQRFFGCSVSYGASCVKLIYAASWLSTPCRNADPQLAAILRRQADEAVARVPDDAPLPLRVRAYVADNIDRGTELSDIATKLAMSERTLRRRLREAGTGYRELVDDVRRERALTLADQGAHSATEIALMVGFDDSATFARAFRRWTGMLPRDYLLARRTHPTQTRASEVDAVSLRLVRGRG
jgi:AraC-like DNA-binding protein